MAKTKEDFRPVVLLPNYWYVWPLVAALFWQLYSRGWLVYYAAYYVVYAYTSPFADFPTVFAILRRLLAGPFPGYPIQFNLVGLGIWVSRMAILWPLETLFWHLDDLIFPGYRNVQVTRPFFLIGQPRSGTTKMETLLSLDEDLISLKMYEIRFPYLTYQYIVDAMDWFDKTVLRGWGFWVAEKTRILYVFEHAGPLAEMRRLRYDLCDEDDVIFLFHFMNHFQLCGAYPDEQIIRRFHRFDLVPEPVRRRMMAFHKKCVQKVLYRRGGPNARYFAKWVAGWNGELESMFFEYPDAEFVCIVRSPSEQLPSWMKLQGLLANALTGVNMMKNPQVCSVIKDENVRWFHNEIRFCREKDVGNFLLLSYEELYKDIPGNIRRIYAKFNRKIADGGAFDRVLKEEQGKQSGHRHTATDESHISQKEIREKYPDLIQGLKDTGRFPYFV